MCVCMHILYTSVDIYYIYICVCFCKYIYMYIYRICYTFIYIYIYIYINIAIQKHRSTLYTEGFHIERLWCCGRVARTTI